jgi:AraC-like DNA-binding protein
VTSFQPRAVLRGRVVSIDIVESRGETTVLPSMGAVLGFQFRGRVRAEDDLLSLAGVTGILDKARRYSYVGETGSILVRFTPQGASCLGVPCSELASQSVALDGILSPARVREVCERLAETQDATEHVAIVEDLLIELPFDHDPLIARAMDLIASTTGEGAAIASVARSLDLSERQLERRFLQRVGITPKRVGTLHRFERAVALASTAPSLTSAALDAGYYDQSHFIRDFRRFTGMAPGTVLGRRR